MLVLSESHLAQSPAAFDQAWMRDPSILILPDQLEDEFWVHARLGLVTPKLQKGQLLLWGRCGAGRQRLSIGSKSKMVEQARCLGSAQRLDAVQRVLISLPICEPFALVNQWIWAMDSGAQRIVVPGLSDPLRLASELSHSIPTFLCLDKVQGEALPELFEGQRFSSVQRVCLVNALPGPWVCSLRALFPNAVFYWGTGSSEAMTYVTMQGENEVNALRCEPMPGVEFRRRPDGRLGFSSRFAAQAQVDDQALKIFEDRHCFLLDDPSTKGPRFVSGSCVQVRKRAV